MGNTLAVLIVLAIIIGLVYWLIQEAKRKVEETKNFIMGEHGKCIDCMHCYQSNGTFHCAFSKRQDIDMNTEMDCVEVSKLKEEDIAEICSSGYFTTEGQAYIKENLLGKKITKEQFDAFLDLMSNEHPEYIIRSQNIGE